MLTGGRAGCRRASVPVRVKAQATWSLPLVVRVHGVQDAAHQEAVLRSSAAAASSTWSRAALTGVAGPGRLSTVSLDCARHVIHSG